MAHLCVSDGHESEDGEHWLSWCWMGPSLIKEYHDHGPTYDSTLPSATHYDWYFMVELYTSCSLTYHKDVLVAISAVAERFSTNVVGKYLAGLRSDDLHRGHMWASIGYDGGNSDMTTTYTAPSWNWACQSYPVSFYFKNMSLLNEAKVLTAETSFTRDPYAQVADGFVLLTTKACKIPSTRLEDLKGPLHDSVQFAIAKFKTWLVSHEG